MLAPDEEVEGTNELPLRMTPAWLSRSRRAASLVSSFLIGQGMSQIMTLLAGLFLVRHLNVESYAQFGLTSGFQQMFLTLMDLGLAGTIVPLVGTQKGDRALVGRYVRSAKHLRDLSFLLIAPIAIFTFFGVMHHQHWAFQQQTILLCSVLLVLYFAGKSSYFAAPLFIHGKLKPYYTCQVAGSAFRLGSYIVLAYFHQLNAVIAVLVMALTVFLSAGWYEREAKPLMDWPPRDDVQTDREVIRYLLPAAPAMAFSAFQAQITLLLISLFGGQTIYIAQVAALGRIGQVFAVLVIFNVIVVEPYIARLNARRLLLNFLLIAGLACVALTPVVFAAFLWPKAFLLLIGPKYSSLRNLLGWVVLAATINFMATLIWMMNRARKWLFWSGTILEIGLLITTQIAFVAIIGVRNTRDAVFLTLAANCCMLIAHVYVAIVGFLRSYRRSRLHSVASPAIG